MTVHSPERLRTRASLRNLVQETTVRSDDLVLPIFLNDQPAGKSKDILSMPGVKQWAVDDSLKFVEECVESGIKSFILFGIVGEKSKDAVGSSAWDAAGPVAHALRLYRKKFGDVVLMADACFCEYTQHGHCGVFHDQPHYHAPVRDTASTLANLAKLAVCYADAGADIVAPSGMVDGMIPTLRQALNEHGADKVALCSYAVKYASGFYGPFREAAENAPTFGDRQTYQMNPANRREAIHETLLDVQAGADMLLVKPGMPYLDIVRDIVERTQIPVGAYQVSGEYSMIQAAAQNGWLDENKTMMESLIAFKRAGAKFVITYWALQAAKLLRR